MSARSYRLRRGLRSAFTLVEMLIAMALTLILVYAIAEFYAFLGDTVKDGRASIEMQATLRGAAQRLKTDLNLVTLPIVPWADDGFAPGYFTIAEGRGNDWDTNGNGNGIAGSNDPLSGIDELEDADGDGESDLVTSGVTNMLGDGDDYIAFTARANGDEPWVGLMFEIEPTGLPQQNTNTSPTSMFTPRMETSRVAEIAWWTSFTDTDGDMFWDFAEPRFVHRRALLIRPDLNVVHPQDTNVPSGTQYFVRLPASSNAEAEELFYFLLQNCDVSLRQVRFANNSLVNANHCYFLANSLAELTRREFRFMNLRGNPLDPASFPNRLDLNPRYAGNPSVQPDRSHPANTNSQYRWVLGDTSATSPFILNTVVLRNMVDNGALLPGQNRTGEDVILSNALAFDVRVFDPTAPLLIATAANSSVTVQPGDPGWTLARNSTNPLVADGFGAYVDLWWGRYAGYAGVYGDPLNPPPDPPGTPSTRFYRAMDRKSQLADPGNLALLAYYDTWALSYERDGINQDINIDPQDTEADEGTDGLDTQITNPNPPPTFIYDQKGVDNAEERETAPPYASPLRGIQVKVRLYEPGTRQARQATVGADFLPE